MKVLFIGGTGIISSACAALAVARGYELYLLNRGASWRVPPAAARLLRADIRDKAAVSRALGRHEFDVVVNWLAYTAYVVSCDKKRRKLPLPPTAAQ